MDYWRNGAELIEEYRRANMEAGKQKAEYILQKEFKSKCEIERSDLKNKQRSVVIENNFPSFKNIQILGTFCWKPKGKAIKQFSEVQEKDILRCLTSWSEKPSKIVKNMSSLTPMTFADLPPNRRAPCFPYDSSHDSSLISSLYFSKKYFGLSTEKIDFLFGGSVLGVLANKHIQNPGGKFKYIAQRYKNIIILVKYYIIRYAKNFNDIGYQFERLVTGKPLHSKHKMPEYKNLQVIEMADFKVLLSAEVDAIDGKGELVEIKWGKPEQFRMNKKLLFQMISNGSNSLVMAERDEKWLKSIKKVSLCKEISRYTSDALQKAERNILDCLKQLKHEIRSDVTYQMDFNENQEMILSQSSIPLLLSAKVITELFENILL